MKLLVRHLDVRTVSSTEYDYCITAIGYESRATFAVSQLKPLAARNVAIDFREQHVLSYQANLAFYQSKNAVLIPEDDGNISTFMRSLGDPGHNPLNTDRLRLLIDISSTSRKIIARLAFECQALADRSSRNIQVDFVYSLSNFGMKPDAFGPIVDNGPAIAEMAGWSAAPIGSSCGAIVGIGYEEDLAMGAVEELEAGHVWAFRPINEDERYEQAIEDGNRGFFNVVPPRHVVRYSLKDPYSVFASLEALAGIAKRDYRLLVIPFGPKIFALSACLTCLRHYPEIGLWRVSGGPNRTPVERAPSGRILGLTVDFLPGTQ